MCTIQHYIINSQLIVGMSTEARVLPASALRHKLKEKEDSLMSTTR